uniref:Uncharacterized protein n=1 Tax=Caenorhabditis japonica TaxID=281687 RepID=A0A8R1E981_CAEJA
MITVTLISAVPDLAEVARLHFLSHTSHQLRLCSLGQDPPVHMTQCCCTLTVCEQPCSLEVNRIDEDE